MLTKSKKNKFKFMIFCLILFNLFTLSLAISQIPLSPGYTNLTIKSIIIYPIEVDQNEGDYVGNPNYPETLLTPQHPLGLNGNITFLQIKWNSKWPDNSIKPIGVKCYLNCPNPGDDIETNCAQYQSCEYLGPPGKHSCFIQYPRYNFTNLNEIMCKFYDPSIPEVYKDYLTRKFWIIDFQTILPSNINIVLGEQNEYLVYIKNLGLLPSSFDINISLSTNPNNVGFEIRNPYITTEAVKSGYTTLALSKILFFSTGSLGINISVKSNIEPVPYFSTYCDIATDCPEPLIFAGDRVCKPNYIGNKRCWQENMIRLSSDLKSLSEYGTIGIIQIILLSAFILFILIRNSRKRRIKK